MKNFPKICLCVVLIFMVLGFAACELGITGADNTGKRARSLGSLRSSASPLNEEDQYALLMGNKNFYFGNLHSHSKESDGEGSASDGFRWARDTMGVDFYAVTDHAINMSLSFWRDNFGKIRKAADDYNDSGNFVAIAGFEWSSITYGHMNCWFTSRYVDSYFGKVSRTDWYEWIRDNNGIAQFNHPGREDDLTFILDDEYMWRNFKMKDFADDYIQTCETGNKSTGNNDLIYYALFLRGLARGWHYAPTSNWDNHDIDSYQHHRTAIISGSLTRDGIRNSMENRLLYSTDDKNTEIIFKYMKDTSDISSENNPWMGSIVAQPADGTVSFAVAVKDPGERIKTIQLVTSVIDNPSAAGEDQKAREVLLAEHTPRNDTDLVVWYPEINLASDINGNEVDVEYVLVKAIMENTEDSGCTGVLNRNPADLSNDIFDKLLYIRGLSASDQMAVSAPIWFE